MASFFVVLASMEVTDAVLTSCTLFTGGYGFADGNVSSYGFKGGCWYSSGFVHLFMGGDGFVGGSDSSCDSVCWLCQRLPLR